MTDPAICIRACPMEHHVLGSIGGDGTCPMCDLPDPGSDPLPGNELTDIDSTGGPAFGPGSLAAPGSGWVGDDLEPEPVGVADEEAVPSGPAVGDGGSGIEPGRLAVPLGGSEIVNA